MGKGGESAVTGGAVVSRKAADVKRRLDKLQTEELKKWATGYGLNSELDREGLIASLV